MVRLLAILVAALAAAVAADPTLEPARPPKPNVVVIMTDDQTYRDMAAMPQTRALIGAAGATFTHNYVSYPLCCPSRATYLTGQYAHNHGVRSTVPPDGGVEALDAQHTLPVWLQAEGYDTIHIGKYLNGYGLRHPPKVPPGWTDWHGAIDKSTYQMWGYKLYENGVTNTYGDFSTPDPALYQTDVLRDKALEAIRAHAGGDRPFFLSLMFVAPHGEVVPPKTTTEPHIRPAPRHAGAFATLPLPRDPAFDEMDISDKPPEVRRLRTLRPGVSSRILRDFRARRESLLAVDEAVGALVRELAATGQLDSTYVLFTSDNGFFQGEHRIAKGKYLAYEASTRVPLLIRGPGIPAGTVSGELVGQRRPRADRARGRGRDRRHPAGRALAPALCARRLAALGAADPARGARRQRRRSTRPRRAASASTTRSARRATSTSSGGAARASSTTCGATRTSCARATPTRATRSSPTSSASRSSGCAPARARTARSPCRLSRRRGAPATCRARCPPRRAPAPPRSARVTATGIRVSKPVFAALRTAPARSAPSRPAPPRRRSRSRRSSSRRRSSRPAQPGDPHRGVCTDAHPRHAVGPVGLVSEGEPRVPQHPAGGRELGEVALRAPADEESPPGSSWTLPWVAASSPRGCSRALSSVAVCAFSSSSSASARECLRTGGNAELSNSVSAPSLRQRASCCQAKCAPAPTLKFDRLPPRRQLITPVSRSIS